MQTTTLNNAPVVFQRYNDLQRQARDFRRAGRPRRRVVAIGGGGRYFASHGRSGQRGGLHRAGA
jgi:hypothetical protein